MDAGLKRKDTTKGPPLRILSLDGGGVRGYSMIIILQELMHRTFVHIEGNAPRRAEIPKPCDHFDLIVGTGTGGLIALMLGRLRLDLEQCKELYVRMTRMVFETDKTFAGIPFKSTLFKASLLEQAIKDAVAEHTLTEDEGHDGTPATPRKPPSSSHRSSIYGSLHGHGHHHSHSHGHGRGNVRRHSSSASVASFSARSPTSQMTRPAAHSDYGDPDAKLYDSRENRTKTVVTAVYKGSPSGSAPAMLRSYDSRKEPAPEYDCTIWEAGRATSAIDFAFKPIKIGQSLFQDDGGGTYNPAPDALDEATVNEWPGRDVGVFVSIGTGRRSKNDKPRPWIQDFMPRHVIEAMDRLVKKIEACEHIHEKMQTDFLSKRGVNVENYYRLNAEMGVGEYGMNEWHRLSEISTGTRRYMLKDEEQRIIHESSLKLAKIHRANQRYARLSRGETSPPPPNAVHSITSPLAVELPGDFPPAYPNYNPPPAPPSIDGQSYDSGADHLSLPSSNAVQNATEPSPRSSDERSRPATAHFGQPAQSPWGQHHLQKPASHGQLYGAARDEPDRLVVASPTPEQYRLASGADKILVTDSEDSYRRPQSLPPQMKPLPAQPRPLRNEPPPLPPKTPLQESKYRRPSFLPPYPIEEEQPPPAVNWQGKPTGR